MAIKTVLKQPEKNAQRDPGEKRWACYYCGKEGHLMQDCPPTVINTWISLGVIRMGACVGTPGHLQSCLS